MENHIRGLEALGKKQDTYGDLLIPIVLAKIPTSIKHNIICENGTNSWTVEQLRKAILKEIQILEAGEETEVFDQANKPFNTFPSTTSLLTNASQIKGRNFSNAKYLKSCETKIVCVLFWSASRSRMHSSSRS